MAAGGPVAVVVVTTALRILLEGTVKVLALAPLPVVVALMLAVESRAGDAG